MAQKEIQYINEESESFEQKAKNLRKLLKICQRERGEYLAGWQRARAEFQNYKKQEAHTAEEFRKFVAESGIRKVLPVLDNLTLACNSIPEKCIDDAWTKGILQIQRQLKDMLYEQGVREIEINEETKFNPSQHEAVLEAESGQPSGTIIEVLQKGYMLNGKVIQATRVKVAK